MNQMLLSHSDFTRATATRCTRRSLHRAQGDSGSKQTCRVEVSSSQETKKYTRAKCVFAQEKKLQKEEETRGEKEREKGVDLIKQTVICVRSQLVSLFLSLSLHLSCALASLVS